MPSTFKNNNKINHTMMRHPFSDMTSINHKALKRIASWLNDHQDSFSDQQYKDAYSVLAALDFVESDAGKRVLSDAISRRTLYYFHSKVDVAFHTENAMGNTKNIGMFTHLTGVFINSFFALTQDENKIAFLKKLHGYCIEARTRSALEYAEKIAMNAPEKFTDLMERVYPKAREAVMKTGIDPLLTPVAEYIVQHYGKVRCAIDEVMCKDGIVSMENVRYFLENIMALSDDLAVEDFEGDNVYPIAASELLYRIKLMLNHLPALIGDDNEDVLRQHHQDLLILLNELINANDKINNELLLPYNVNLSTSMQLLRDYIMAVCDADADIKLWLDEINIEESFNKIKDKFKNILGCDLHLMQMIPALIDALLAVKSIFLFKKIDEQVELLNEINLDQCVKFTRAILIQHMFHSYGRKSKLLADKAAKLLEVIEEELAKPDLDAAAINVLKLQLFQTAKALYGAEWVQPSQQQVREYENLAGEFRLFKVQPVRGKMLDFAKVWSMPGPGLK